MGHYLRVSYRNVEINDPDFQIPEDGLPENQTIPKVWIPQPNAAAEIACVHLPEGIAQALLQDNAHPSRTVEYFAVALGDDRETAPTLLRASLREATQETQTVSTVEAEVDGSAVDVVRTVT